MMPAKARGDKRFKDSAWLTASFGFYRQSYSITKACGEAVALAWPSKWVEDADLRDGSWWLAWPQWLDERSDDRAVKPPRMGGAGRALNSMEAAPGSYVMQR
jgi:polyhydroxyalkanoate synthase